MTRGEYQDKQLWIEVKDLADTLQDKQAQWVFKVVSGSFELLAHQKPHEAAKSIGLLPVQEHKLILLDALERIARVKVGEDEVLFGAMVEYGWRTSLIGSLILDRLRSEAGVQEPSVYEGAQERITEILAEV